MTIVHGTGSSATPNPDSDAAVTEALAYFQASSPTTSYGLGSTGAGARNDKYARQDGDLRREPRPTVWRHWLYFWVPFAVLAGLVIITQSAILFFVNNLAYVGGMIALFILGSQQRTLAQRLGYDVRRRFFNRYLAPAWSTVGWLAFCLISSIVAWTAFFASLSSAASSAQQSTTPASPPAAAGKAAPAGPPTVAVTGPGEPAQDAAFNAWYDNGGRAALTQHPDALPGPNASSEQIEKWADSLLDTPSDTNAVLDIAGGGDRGPLSLKPVATNNGNGELTAIISPADRALGSQWTCSKGPNRYLATIVQLPGHAMNDKGWANVHYRLYTVSSGSGKGLQIWLVSLTTNPPAGC